MPALWFANSLNTSSSINQINHTWYIFIVPLFWHNVYCVCMKQTSFSIHYLPNDFSKWWRLFLSFISVLNVAMQFRKSADCNAHQHNNMLEADVLCIKVECCYRYSVFPASSYKFYSEFILIPLRLLLASTQNVMISNK